MDTYKDENGNTCRKRGDVVEVVEPGPKLKAEIDAGLARLAARKASVSAAKDAEARILEIAEGKKPAPTKPADVAALLKDMADILANR